MANGRESGLQAWPSQPFRNSSPEYFFPNHQRFATKISKLSETWVGGGLQPPDQCDCGEQSGGKVIVRTTKRRQYL